MAHSNSCKSNIESNILKILLEHDEEGLTRHQIASAIGESDLGKVISALGSLKQKEFVTESLSMVLDGIDPDDVSIWFMAEPGIEYLNKNS